MSRDQSSRLNVFFEDIFVGEIARDSSLVFSFSYSDTWLRHPKKFPLSLAMPLQREKFGHRETLSFFENLLPGGDVRLALEKSQKIRGTFDFLNRFGKDCAGAVIVSSERESPFSPEPGSEIEIDLDQIEDAIDEKRSVAEVVAGKNPGFLSIAGAQDKFPAIFRDHAFFLPLNGKPTTHIVKVPVFRSGVKGSVFNEFYCMKLAGLVGLNVAHCEIVSGRTHSLYVTERYDRLVAKSGVVRIHQQDFCQAQGVTSEHKYEEQGGPDLKDNYGLIKKYVSVRYRSSALFSCLDWVCFNLLTGNNDSHSKNLSLLFLDNKIQLAPFYDLMCTAVYPKLKNNFSFLIGDRDDGAKIGRNQLLMVDQSLGLKDGTMRERMADMQDRLLANKDQLAKDVMSEHAGAHIVEKIASFIEKRCKSLRRQGL